MDQAVFRRIDSWMSGPYDDAVKEELRRMQSDHPESLLDAFRSDLAFGTGGMRAVMGVGTNRMNRYTIQFATQGLANYLLKEKTLPFAVFIGYDVRHNSRLFAEEAAKVLAGNGIGVFLASELCPTPLASFGCRHLGCAGAIMITASHNPPEYNGYKVYGQDGAQIVAPHDAGITMEVRRIHTPNDVRLSSLDDPLIRWVGEELDAAYLKAIAPVPMPAQTLRIVYSNLHGTGLRLMPKALRRWGFGEVALVDEQAPLDGAFPAAPSPNPEDANALALGTAQLEQSQADLFLATDPDADRIGAVALHQGTGYRLNGHEIGCLLLNHLIKRPLPPSGAVLKTIVTTELLAKIARGRNLACVDVLTGFKFIAEQIRLWEAAETPTFFFGAEESHGYLFHTFARDKDAISAGCLLAEAASVAKQRGWTLIDELFNLYRIHGVHRQALRSLPSTETLLNSLRENPPAQIGPLAVLRVDDYLKGELLPRSDVLFFALEGGAKLVIRPSGTEPKIKLYAEVCAPPSLRPQEAIPACDKQLQELLHAFLQYAEQNR